MDGEPIGGLYTRFKDMWYLKGFMFFSLFVTDITDCACDWLLYSTLVRVQPGLVFGETNTDIVYSSLAFAIIGSFLFIVELLNTGLHAFKGKPFFEEDAMSVLIIWLADIPQVTIFVIVSACHEELSFPFSVIKATIILVSIIIRVLISIAMYCKRKKMPLSEKRQARLRPGPYQRTSEGSFHIFGIILLLTGAVTIYLFSMMERGHDGRILMKIPNSISKQNYVRDHYYKDIGIFYHHPAFDSRLNENSMATERDEKLNWIRFSTIQDMENTFGTEVTYVIRYARRDTDHTRFILYQNMFLTEDKSDLQVKNCFELEMNNMTIKHVYNQTACDATLDGLDVNKITVTLTYISKTNNLRFGNIHYSARLARYNGMCHMALPWMEEDKLETDNATEIEIQQNIGRLQYFRVPDDVNYEFLKQEGNVTLYKSENVTLYKSENVTLYKSDDFIDVVEAWRTNYCMCSSTADRSPKRADTLEPGDILACS